MKYSKINKIPLAAPCKSPGQWISVDFVDETAVLDFWEIDKASAKCSLRYAINTKSGEYAKDILPEKNQSSRQRRGTDFGWTNRGLDLRYRSEKWTIADGKEGLKARGLPDEEGKLFRKIASMEYEHNFNIRERNRKRHEAKIQELMDKIPPMPDGFLDWLDRLSQEEAYFRIPDKGYEGIEERRLKTVSCTSCGAKMLLSELKGEDSPAPSQKEKVMSLLKGERTAENEAALLGIAKECLKAVKAQKRQRAKDGEALICPHCGKKGVVKLRKRDLDKMFKVCLFQDIDEHLSAARHFDVYVHRAYGQEVQVWKSECMRVLCLKGDDKKTKYKLFYNQHPFLIRHRGYYYGYYGHHRSCTINDNLSLCDDELWDTRNGRGGRAGKCLAYPRGIEEALRGTMYERWSRAFEAAAAKGLRLDYNTLMASGKERLPEVTELLIKGRFYRIAEEMTNYMDGWGGFYLAPDKLNLGGGSINEVFKIEDRQLINRLRDKAGGLGMLGWLQWSDKNKIKLPDSFIDFMDKGEIRDDLVQKMSQYMSPVAAVNYIVRHSREDYRKLSSLSQIAEAYVDYISMCKKLKKNIKDPMVYKPRELKRRHDEAAEEINRQKILEEMETNKALAAEEAKKYREDFPGAERELSRIKPKFEWEDDDYVVKVPETLIDIVAEGRALHHCAGATDRYFDRIAQRETYICFLRKKADPDMPYYTIEIEPGGTIRQHRGYLDEEPDIEAIKPHLRAWQKAVKERMTKQDREDARVSKIKREENIKDLVLKNNVRVLKGLEQDFMEIL